MLVKDRSMHYISKVYKFSFKKSNTTILGLHIAYDYIAANCRSDTDLQYIQCGKYMTANDLLLDIQSFVRMYQDRGHYICF